MKIRNYCSSTQDSKLLGTLVGTGLAALVALSSTSAVAMPDCFDTQEKRDVFSVGELVGERQVEQLWKGVESDCDRLPELSLGLIRQVGDLMTALDGAPLPSPLHCRIAGRISGVNMSWFHLISECSDDTNQSEASSSEPEAPMDDGAGRSCM